MSGKDIRESVGLLLVVASMVFVALEIRQNTAAMRAATRQGLAERNAQVIYAVAENPELARAWDIRWSSIAPADSVMTPTDSTQASWAIFGMLRMVENVYLQYLEGVVDESVLDTYGFHNNIYFASDKFRAYWPTARSRFDPRFVPAFEAEYGLTR